MRPFCSIFIVNWNSWSMLSRCLEALSRQTFSDFKVFVADNGSDTPPPEEILKILPNIVYVQNKKNEGFAAANNALLRMAGDTQWVVLLNPDAYPRPDWLENLVNAARDYPEYQFFASRLLQAHKPALLDGEGDVYHISGLAWRSGFGRPAKNGGAPREIFTPSAAAAMYRTDILRQIGGFDEDFFCYFEDVDLGFRLRLAGYRCLLVPDSVVLHEGSATTGGQQSNCAVYYGHRNLVWTYIKDMPSVLFWTMLPLHIFLSVFSLAYIGLRGQWRVILRAKRDAIYGIPTMWRKRRQIQRQRAVSVWSLFCMMDKRIVPRDIQSSRTER